MQAVTAVEGGPHARGTRGIAASKSATASNRRPVRTARLMRCRTSSSSGVQRVQPSNGVTVEPTILSPAPRARSTSWRNPSRTSEGSVWAGGCWRSLTPSWTSTVRRPGSARTSRSNRDCPPGPNRASSSSSLLPLTPRSATADPGSRRANWSGQRRSASSGVPTPSEIESPSTATTGPWAPVTSTPVRRNTEVVRTPSTLCEACVLRWKDNGPVGPGSRVSTVSADPSVARSPSTGSLVRDAPAASHACRRPPNVTGRPPAVTGPTSTGMVPKAWPYLSRTRPPAERRTVAVNTPSVSPADATVSVAVGAVCAVAQDVTQDPAGPRSPGPPSGCAARAPGAVTATAVTPAAAVSTPRLAGPRTVTAGTPRSGRSRRRRCRPRRHRCSRSWCWCTPGPVGCA